MTIEQAVESYKASQIMRICGWGVQDFMRRAVANYRSSGNVRELEEAITAPQNRRNMILTYIADNGTAIIDEYLAVLGIVTRSQLNTYSLNLCSYTQDLFDRYTGGETADSIATDIETNIENYAIRFDKLSFRFSTTYTDLFGR